MVKKILMLLENPFPEDIRVRYEAMALTEAGSEVHLCVPEFMNRNLSENMDGVKIHRFYISSVIFRCLQSTAARFALYHYFWLSQINKIEESFSYIHIHDLPLAKTGFILSQKWQIPWILDLHENYPALLYDSGNTNGILKGYFFNIQLWKKYEKWAISKATHVITVVEEAKKRLYDLMTISKVTVVSNTQPLKLFSPSKIIKANRESIRLFYAGGIGEHRGLETVVRSIALIYETVPQIEFVIVGTGRSEKNLKQLIADHKMESRIKLLGWKPFEEVIRMIQEADVCVVPHLATEHTNSTIPHKLFQYMSMAKPVIVSDCLPLKRVVLETECGIVFENGNPQSFAEKMMCLLNERLRNRMGENGRRAVLEKYNWTQDGQVLKDLYSNL